MPKTQNPAGKGGAVAERLEAQTSIQPADYKPDDAISSVLIDSGRTLLGFVIEFSTGFHAVDTHGRALGIFRAQRPAVDVLRGVQP